MALHHRFYITQAQAVSPDILTVALCNAIIFLEYLLLFLLRNAGAAIRHADKQPVSLRFGNQADGAALSILAGIVQQVVYGIFQVEFSGWSVTSKEKGMPSILHNVSNWRQSSSSGGRKSIGSRVIEVDARSRFPNSRTLSM